MIIIEGVEIFRNNVPVFIHEQWPLQMEDTNVIEPVSDHEIDLALQVCGMIYFVFSLLSV